MEVNDSKSVEVTNLEIGVLNDEVVGLPGFEPGSIAPEATSLDQTSRQPLLQFIFRNSNINVGLALNFNALYGPANIFGFNRLTKRDLLLIDWIQFESTVLNIF
jgi:hypothetical protein